MEPNYHSLAALIEAAQSSGQTISALVLAQQAAQMEQSEAELYEAMRQSYLVMADSVQAGKAPGVRTASGHSGGDAFRMERARQTQNDQCRGVFT